MYNIINDNDYADIYCGTEVTGVYKKSNGYEVRTANGKKYKIKP